MKVASGPYGLAVLLGALFFPCAYAAASQIAPPRLTVQVVIDQCSYSVLESVVGYMRSGLKYIYEEGVLYTQAYQLPPKAASEMSMLADHLVWSTNVQVSTFALKRDAALASAGSLGTPFWFDADAGKFVSTQSLPAWVMHANSLYAKELDHYTWKPTYALDGSAYTMLQRDQEERGQSCVPGGICSPAADAHNAYAYVAASPLGDALVMDLARRCVEHTDKDQQLVLVLHLNSLGGVVQRYGAYSREAIDILHHIDEEFGHFMHTLFERYAPEEVLFVVMANRESEDMREPLQVPLMVYRSGSCEHQIVHTEVSLGQVAPTVAYLLEGVTPADGLNQLLPGCITMRNDVPHNNGARVVLTREQPVEATQEVAASARLAASARHQRLHVGDALDRTIPAQR